MEEKDLAADLHRSKDDAAEWGEEAPRDPATKPAKRRLAAMISVRLSPDELEKVQKRAEDLGQTVSAYLRGLAMRDATPGVEPMPLGSSNFVSLSSAETYLTHVENPRVTVDGSRLQSRAG